MEHCRWAGSISGCVCSPLLSLQVNREIVSGLKYIQHTFRKGVKSKCCSVPGRGLPAVPPSSEQEGNLWLPRPCTGALGSVHVVADGPGCACSSWLGAQSRPERQ